MRMPRLRRLGASLLFGMHEVGELGRHLVEQVELAVQERQPARLVLLDDRDLDAVDAAAAGGP